jgi:hypothetical protein
LFSVQNSRVNYNRLDIGGDKQDRTADLLHAMQALSQLSYTPKIIQALDYSALRITRKVADDL